VADWSAKFQGSTTSGSSYGLLIRSGTTSADTALSVQGPTGTPSLLFVRGDGNVGIGTASPSSLGANYTTLDIRGSSGGGFKFGNATQHAYMYSDSSGFALSTQTNLPLNFYTNNAQLRASVGSTSLDISSTSNYGLKLQSTPGNTNPNTLDCYNENTSWSPTVTWGTGGTVTTTSATGAYTQIGNVVTFTVTIAYNCSVIPTGGSISVDLPRTSASGLNQRPGLWAFNSFNGTAGSNFLSIGGGVTTAQLRVATATGTADIATNLTVTASGALVVTATYLAS
jgi:hypothetical protein